MFSCLQLWLIASAKVTATALRCLRELETRAQCKGRVELQANGCHRRVEGKMVVLRCGFEVDLKNEDTNTVEQPN
jgi:hypothetical protein